MSTVTAVLGAVIALGIFVITLYTAAQGIRTKATTEEAVARADQLAKRVEELEEAVKFERGERQRERGHCDREIARVTGQLEAATSAWARGLAPEIATELQPHLTRIVREAVG